MSEMDIGYVMNMVLYCIELYCTYWMHSLLDTILLPFNFCNNVNLQSNGKSVSYEIIIYLSLEVQNTLQTIFKTIHPITTKNK